MKIITVFAFFCTCVLISCSGVKPPALLKAQTQVDLRKITELESQWMEALVRKDTTVLNKILSKDFAISATSAVKETRQQYLETAVNTPRTLQPIELEDREIKSYGSIVISTGKATYKGEFRGNKFDLPVRYTHIFRLSEGEWLVESAHFSAIR